MAYDEQIAIFKGIMYSSIFGSFAIRINFTKIVL